MRYRRAALAVTLVVLLTGCWDRREVNDIAFVLASAVDREGDQYRISLQIPLPGRMGGGGGKASGGKGAEEKPWILDSAVGPSIREANNRQQKALSRQLYFAHRRVLLMGEEATRMGLEPIVDVLARVPQNRLTSFVVMSKGPARDVLAVDAPVEQFPAEMVRELAVSSMRSPRTLKHLVETMVVGSGRDPLLPVMVTHTTEPGGNLPSSKLIKLAGFGVFRANKLACILEEKDAMGLLWTMGQARNPGIRFPLPDGTGSVFIQFPEQKTDLQPSVQGNRISVHAQVTARGTIIENNGRFSLRNDRDMEELTRLVKEEISEIMEGAMNRLQTECESDPVGMGDLVHRQFPAVWRRIRTTWYERYRDLRFVAEVQVHLANPGALVEPLGVPEGEITE